MLMMFRAIGILLAALALVGCGVCGIAALSNSLIDRHSPDANIATGIGLIGLAFAALAAWVLWLLVRGWRNDRARGDTSNPDGM